MSSARLIAHSTWWQMMLRRSGLIVLGISLVWAATLYAQAGPSYERLIRRVISVDHWTSTHAPAAATQATATQAAAAGVVHVADCVSATMVVTGTAAGAVSAVTLNLRDGATGAGTVLASWDFVLPVTATTSAPPIQICGLDTDGTKGNAMTLEFSAAGATNTLEKVTLSGYDR